MKTKAKYPFKSDQQVFAYVYVRSWSDAGSYWSHAKQWVPAKVVNTLAGMCLLEYKDDRTHIEYVQNECIMSESAYAKKNLTA